MSKRSYAERIKDAEVMLSGIKSHMEELAQRGVGESNRTTKNGFPFVFLCALRARQSFRAKFSTRMR